MINTSFKFNSLLIPLVFALGMVLIGYQIILLGDNGFLYLIGTAVCLYCSNQIFLNTSVIQIAPSILLPFFFNGFVFLQALPFLLLPDGAKIRPIGWVFCMVFIGLFLTVGALVFLIERYRTEPSKFAWFIGLTLVFCPIPTAMASLHLMVAIKGFELLP